MHVRRTHGVAPGIVLVLLGAWVAAVPYVGPHFHYSVGSVETWHWTAGRLWLSLVPGAITVLAGLVLVGATRRGTLVAASCVAVLAGIWVVVGPEISRLWHGSMRAGPAAGDVHHQVYEVLGYSLLSGCLIAVVASFALGRASVVTVQDVRHDIDVRQQGLEPIVMTQTQAVPASGPLVDAGAASPAATARSADTGDHRRSWRRRAQPSQPEVIDLRPSDAPPPGPSTAATPEPAVQPTAAPPPPTNPPTEMAPTAPPDQGQRPFTPPPPPPAPR